MYHAQLAPQDQEIRRNNLSERYPATIQMKG